MATTTVGTSLKWDVLVTKRQGLTRDLPPGKEQWMWVPTSATLIHGERDAVLVDTFLTIEQSDALVKWIAASGKNLTRLRHPRHGDHFFTWRHFWIVSRPERCRSCGQGQRQQASLEFVEASGTRYPGQIPSASWLPELEA
jgi:hypothetical protein